MRYPTIHTFLKWAPATIVSGAGATAAIWTEVKDWITAQAVWAWHQMSDPLFAATVILFLGAYIWAIIWTGRTPKAKPTQPEVLIGEDLDRVRFEAPLDGRTEARHFSIEKRHTATEATRNPLSGKGELFPRWRENSFDDAWESANSKPSTPASVTPEQAALGFVFEGANIFVVTEGGTKTGIAISGKIWNAGAPTFITDWQLRVVLNAGASVPAHHSVIPERLQLTGRHTAILRATDSLVTKLEDEAITDKPVKGVLLFYAEAAQSRVQSVGTTLELTVTDNQNRRSVFTKNLGDWLRMSPTKVRELR